MLSKLRNTIKFNLMEHTLMRSPLKENALQTYNKVKNEIIYKKALEMNSWYTKITGLDQVRVSQNVVTALQEQLLTAQEKRRAVGKELSEVRSKSNLLQDQIHRIKRQEEPNKFLDLMIEETELLRKEVGISTKFNEYDKEEREIFTAFTHAVKDSYEKQRAQLEYTKYFGYVLSIICTFMGFLYSTLKRKDVEDVVRDALKLSKNDIESILCETRDLKNLLEVNKQENSCLNENVVHLFSTTPIFSENSLHETLVTGFRVSLVVFGGLLFIKLICG